MKTGCKPKSLNKNEYKSWQLDLNIGPEANFRYLNGAGGPKVRELPLLVRVDLNIQWERPKLDLAELARKRWIEKWSVSRMAGYFGRSPETIQMHICKLRKGEGSLNFLKTKERKYVQHQMKKVFKGV